MKPVTVPRGGMQGVWKSGSAPMMGRMSHSKLEMRPWDERPRREAIAKASNILYNANLTGRPGKSIDDLVSPYIEEGAEEVLRRTYDGALAEGRRLAGRSAVVHTGSRGEATVGAHYFADAIHASGQNVPSNFMVRPRVAAALGYVVGEPIEHPDVTYAEIIARVRAVHAVLFIEGQRTGLVQQSTVLECITDNGHADHIVLSAKALPLHAVDPAELSFDVSVGSLAVTSALRADLAHHLVQGVRQSVAVVGAIGAGEILVTPPTESLLDFPLGETASIKSTLFGEVQVHHSEGEFEEGFLSMPDGVGPADQGLLT